MVLAQRRTKVVCVFFSCSLQFAHILNSTNELTFYISVEEKRSMNILDFPWSHFYFVVMTLYLNKRLVYDIKLLSFKLHSEWVKKALLAEMRFIC